MSSLREQFLFLIFVLLPFHIPPTTAQSTYGRFIYVCGGEQCVFISPNRWQKYNVHIFDPGVRTQFSNILKLILECVGGWFGRLIRY